MHNSVRTLMRLAVISLVTGCVGDGCHYDFTRHNGLADNGDFHYSCVGAADPYCGEEGTPVEDWGNGPPLPAAIARGARFGLQFDGMRPVSPVSPNVVRAEADQFVALRPGPVGFIVGSGDEVLDAISLRVLEAEGLEISAADSVPLARALLPGEPRVFRAVGLARNRLAGTLPISWAVDRPAAARITAHPDGTCEVVGLEAGELRLRAQFDRLEAEALLRVEDTSNIDASAMDATSEPDDANTVDASEGGEQ